MATQDLSAYGLASRTGGKRTLVYFQDFITAESVQTNGTGEYISSLSGTWALLSQVATAGGVLQVNLDTTAVYSAGVSMVPAFPLTEGLKGEFRFRAFSNTNAAGLQPAAGAIGFRGTDGVIVDPITTGTQTYAVLTFVESTGALTLKACKASNSSKSVTLTQTHSTTGYNTVNFNFTKETDDTITLKLLYNGALAATMTDAVESTAVLAPLYYIKNGASSTKGDATLQLDYVHVNCKVNR
jgi:hypothetical protein